MATVAQVARDRKNVLKALLQKSKMLDARQEALEREVKRLVARKKAVPEVVDMERLIGLADASAAALDTMVQAIRAAVSAFRL